MIKSFLLCTVLLFALNEPGCETNTGDAKNEVHQPTKPEPGCANLNCTELAPAATPVYNEPTPTFETSEEKDGALNTRNADGTPYWSAVGCDGSSNPNGGQPWPQGGTR